MPVFSAIINHVVYVKRWCGAGEVRKSDYFSFDLKSMTGYVRFVSITPVGSFPGYEKVILLVSGIIECFTVKKCPKLVE